MTISQFLAARFEHMRAGDSQNEVAAAAAAGTAAPPREPISISEDMGGRPFETRSDFERRRERERYRRRIEQIRKGGI